MCSWYCCVSSPHFNTCTTNTSFYFHRILFCRFLLTRKKSNTDGQDGIELNVNTAYDTVKYERPPFQQRPPEPDTSQNPYENWVMT